MIDNAEYRDPIMTKIIDILKKDGPGDYVRNYVYGYVDNRMHSEMPIISITKDDANQSTESQATDKLLETYLINLFVSWTANEADSSDLVRGQTELFKIIDNKDADGRPGKGGILYALRNKVQVAPSMFIGLNRDTAPTVDYGGEVESVGDDVFSVSATVAVGVEIRRIPRNRE